MMNKGVKGILEYDPQTNAFKNYLKEVQVTLSTKI